ncbi:hypothetical protein FDH10_gp38 [Propionibacterium phage Doucette]|uniref:Uncharacterized protein n=1 Tax=Propionibacterium phage Doucette TaxID=1897534 RepID=A0A1D8ETS0_9CAUD|nr:hypothetical protein FDH10_gp38 [Propionibacterium phage Doucette]AOT24451.1 hypothetical protein DOUCETTE_38 [Propionibacterium phage Doucette]
MRPPVVETPDVKVPAAPAGPRFFKAVTLYGTDFHTGTVPWLPADGAPVPEGGWLVEHSHPGQVGSWDAIGYLSAATVETDCTGFQWPARLLSVEPVGDMWTPQPEKFPRKRAAHAWRVIGELPAWQLLGPQGREVAAIIEQAADLDSTQIKELSDAWGAAWGAARDAALGAALGAARNAALGAARNAALGAALGAAQDAALGAAQDAIRGLLVLDLEPDAAEILLAPWVSVMGRSWEVTA